MEAATQEAVKQLKDAQKMVQDLVKNDSTAQHIADALVFLNNAVEYFKKNDSAENAAGTLKTVKQAWESMAGPGKKSKPSAQEQRPVETPEQEKVKDAERAVRDVVCWRCQPLRTDQREREAVSYTHLTLPTNREV